MPKPKGSMGMLAMMSALGVMPDLETHYPHRVSSPHPEEDRQARLKEAQDKRDRRNAKRRGAI